MNRNMNFWSRHQNNWMDKCTTGFLYYSLLLRRKDWNSICFIKWFIFNRTVYLELIKMSSSGFPFICKLCLGNCLFSCSQEVKIFGQKKAIPSQSIPPNRSDRSFLHYYETCKYLIICELFKVICDGKPPDFVNKMDQHSIAHKY